MDKVLLLNATYEPLKIVTIRHAFELLFDKKAYAVEGLSKILHSPSTEFEVASVIRLAHYVNAPRRKIKWSKRAVLARDNYKCIYCGIKVGDTHKRKVVGHTHFSVEHILPQSRNGKNTWSNTACACKPCNHRKGDRTPHEAGMKLLWEPKTPRANTFVVSGNFPVEWKNYLQWNNK